MELDDRTKITDIASAKMVYMVGTFPALTETFILREIAALRRRGLDIAVWSIRRPNRAQAAVSALGADVISVYARPDCLSRHAIANLYYALRQPKRYFKALGTIL